MLEMISIIIKAGIHSATPILFVALGETIVERSGVINLGLEGMMIIGALSGFFFGLLTGSFITGLLCAMLITGIFSLIHAFMTITLKANQVVTGLSLTFLGLGLSSYLGKSFIGKTAPYLKDVPIPFFSNLPFVGQIFFNQNFLVYLSFLLIPLLWFYLYRTRSGLYLQVCGESPSTADTAGINVNLTRYLSVFFGGITAGIGGAFLTLGDACSWMDGITAGRGWIAVAIVIFGNWDPVKVSIGSYLFGSLQALQFRLQAHGITLPPTILEMIPYIFTILALTLTSLRRFSNKIGSPKVLGNPYERESRD